MKIVVIALLGLAMSFCCDAGEATTNEVLHVFQQAAMAIAQGQPSAHTKAFLSGKIEDSGHLSVQVSTFSNAFHQIDSTLSSEERKTLILKGDLPGLKRPGKCWIIESFGGMGNEISGCLDYESKELVVLWIRPEG